MRILISPTAFKGTLSPHQAARLILRGAKKKFPSASFSVLPLADGGDGTLEVLSTPLHAKKMTTRVQGPLGKPVRAAWARAGKTAVIEMARASGLALVKGKNRIMEATSTGTGELLRAAMDRGAKKILMGVGGTACADGGAGALRALGLRYYDAHGKELTAKPSDLARLSRVDFKNLDARLKRTNIFILCDVRNPLLGPSGSARTFAPQKGASPSQVRQLEKIMAHWSKFASRPTKNKPGAGAAGALAFGLSAFIGAKLMPGTPFIMRELKWDKAKTQADMIFTGEGRLDKTSFQGKVIGEILKRRGHSKVVAICGSSLIPARDARRAGLFGVISLKDFV